MTKQDLTTQLYQDFMELKRVIVGRIVSDSELNIPPSQAEVLFIVGKHGPMSVKDIAQMQHTSSGAVSQIVEALVEKDLLERSENPDDRRVVLVGVTKASKAALDSLRSQHRERMAEVVDVLDAEELETLSALLRKIIKSYNTGK